MYDQFYRFKAEPFLLSPDHAFAYVHKGYSKARAYMAYAFMRQAGFVMITGRPGTGKTTLIRNYTPCTQARAGGATSTRLHWRMGNRGDFPGIGRVGCLGRFGV